MPDEKELRQAVIEVLFAYFGNDNYIPHAATRLLEVFREATEKSWPPR